MKKPGKIIEDRFLDCTPIKRAVVVGPHGKPEGALLYITSEPAKCGCRIVGNGTLPHPLKIEFCAQHAQPVKIKIDVGGGLVERVRCNKPTSCQVNDRDCAAIGERSRCSIQVEPIST